MSSRSHNDLTVIKRELSEMAPSIEVTKVLGVGAYGVVVEGILTSQEGEKKAVALKRINNQIFSNIDDSIRILREIQLLSHFQSNPQVVQLLDILVPGSAAPTSGGFYIVMEKMHCDLKTVIDSRQPLSSEHIAYFMYQLIRSLKSLHASDVIHRDVTSANCLVSLECELKLCDFGLAKGHEAGEDLTNYVTCRWYRAPEVLMNHKQYSSQIDMWGAGCILGELLLRKPIFKGKSSLHQLDEILRFFGRIPEADLFGTDEMKRYVLGQTKSLSHSAPSWARCFPNVNPLAIDLLSKILCFNPEKRLTASEALRHPFLAQYYYPPEDEHQFCVSMKTTSSSFVFHKAPLRTIHHVKEAIMRQAVALKSEKTQQQDEAASGGLLTNRCVSQYEEDEEAIKEQRSEEDHFAISMEEEGERYFYQQVFTTPQANESIVGQETRAPTPEEEEDDGLDMAWNHKQANLLGNDLDEGGSQNGLTPQRPLTSSLDE